VQVFASPLAGLCVHRCPLRSLVAKDRASQWRQSANLPANAQSYRSVNGQKRRSNRHLRVVPRVRTCPVRAHRSSRPLADVCRIQADCGLDRRGGKIAEHGIRAAITRGREQGVTRRIGPRTYGTNDAGAAAGRVRAGGCAAPATQARGASGAGLPAPSGRPPNVMRASSPPRTPRSSTASKQEMSRRVATRGWMWNSLGFGFGRPTSATGRSGRLPGVQLRSRFVPSRPVRPRSAKKKGSVPWGRCPQLEGGTGLANTPPWRVTSALVPVGIFV